MMVCPCVANMDGSFNLNCELRQVPGPSLDTVLFTSSKRLASLPSFQAFKLSSRKELRLVAELQGCTRLGSEGFREAIGICHSSTYQEESVIQAGDRSLRKHWAIQTWPQGIMVIQPGLGTCLCSHVPYEQPPTVSLPSPAYRGKRGSPESYQT